MRVAGFLKIRNEVLRGNLDRVLENLNAYCDEIFVCDDASTDDPGPVLRQHGVPARNVLRFDTVDFEAEASRKQALLDGIHASHTPPDWIVWLDADETLDRDGTRNLRALLDDEGPTANYRSIALAQIDLWGGPGRYRAPLAAYPRVWRYGTGLKFSRARGLHGVQVPQGLEPLRSGPPPFRVLHYAMATSQSAVERVWRYGPDSLKRGRSGLVATPAAWFPVGGDLAQQDLTARDADEGRAAIDMTAAGIKRLRDLERPCFAVIVPTYNRGDDRLRRALASVQAQTETSWVCFVLDDGSDAQNAADTETIVRDLRDPRFFYLGWPENRGGVAMNEIGMALACEYTAVWTRLGSDDWWEPSKLAAHLPALATPIYADVAWGPFQAVHGGEPREVCAGAYENARERLLRGEFTCSWANCAVGTEALRRVHARWGNFCDGRLRNMEDWEVNRRLAAINARFVWHSARAEGVDAYWTASAPDGASGPAKSAIMAQDSAVQRDIYANAKPRPTLSVVMMTYDAMPWAPIALAGVLPHADEVIWCDGSWSDLGIPCAASNDGTRAAMNQALDGFPGRVVRLDALGDVDQRQARTNALRACTGDLIAIVDADEVLDVAGWRAVIAAAQGGRAVQVAARTFFLDGSLYVDGGCMLIVPRVAGIEALSERRTSADGEAVRLGAHVACVDHYSYVGLDRVRGKNRWHRFAAWSTDASRAGADAFEAAFAAAWVRRDTEGTARDQAVADLAAAFGALHGGVIYAFKPFLGAHAPACARALESIG